MADFSGWSCLKGRFTIKYFFLIFLLSGMGINQCLAAPNAPVLNPDSLKTWDSIINRNLVINNDLARHYAFLALRQSMNKNDRDGLILAYYNLGRTYLRYDPAKSYTFFSTAHNLIKRENSNTLYPRIIYYKAFINNIAFNKKDALILLDTCINASSRLKDYEFITMALILKATIALDVFDSLRAKQLFDSAYVLADRYHCEYQKGVALVNQTITETKRIETNWRINTEKKALKLMYEIPGKEEEYADVLVNIGSDYDNPDSSLKYNLAALSFAQKFNLLTIQISAYNNLAYMYLDQHRISEAIECVSKHAIPLASQIQDHDWLSNLYDSYAEILFVAGNYRQSAELQKKALEEKQLFYQQFSSNQVRLISSILDLNRKDVEISNHKKTIQLQGAKLSQFRLLSLSLVLLLLFSIGIIVLVIQRTRIKLQRKQIESARELISMEESEKNRIAMELHDSIGPFFQSVIFSIESIEPLDPAEKKSLIQKFKDFKQTIRAVSYRMNNNILNQFSFEDSINDLTGLYLSSGKGNVVLRISGKVEQIQDDVKLHIYRIIQELLTNAQKYASAGSVYLTIGIHSRVMTIYYCDQGPGFEPKNARGMGISNINYRVLLMQGKAVLETSPGNPTSWDIRIPL